MWWLVIDMAMVILVVLTWSFSLIVALVILILYAAFKITKGGINA